MTDNPTTPETNSGEPDSNSREPVEPAPGSDPIACGTAELAPESSEPCGPFTRSGVCAVHTNHTLAGVGLGDVADYDDDGLGSYVTMFAEYVREQRAWIGPAQQPLVFHMQKLCRKLDANPDAPASLSSAYLQAFRRLDLQRPGNTQPAGAAGDLPGQRSIFDELDN